MIDKSIRQYQNRVGLKYGRSPGEAQARGSGASSHGSTSGGGGGGGGGGAAAQAAASAAAAARSRAAAAEAAAKSKRDMQATIAKAEKAEAARVAAPISGGESMARFGTPVYAGMDTKVADDMISRGEGNVDVGFQEALKKQNIKKPIVDAREKYISEQYIKPTDIYGDADLEEQKEIDDIRAERNLQFNPNLSRDKRNALEVGLGLRDPKQSSGFLKGLGTLAAGIFLPALLPAKLAKTYATYKQLNMLSSAAKKFGFTKDDKMLSLRSKFLNPDMRKQLLKDDTPKVANLTNKKKRTTTDDRGDGVNRILPESLQSTVSEGTQKFISDEMKEQYSVQQNKMKAALAEGYYVDQNGKRIALDDEKINALTQFITKIDSLLVDPVMMADGGRIDKPFAGRSRDI